MSSLWQSIAIILVVSFISLGLRAGTVVALSISLDPRRGLPDDGASWHRPAACRSARSSSPSPCSSTTRCLTTDAMVRRLSEGEDKASAATYAYRTLAFPMLTGTFVTMAGFLPIGFARSSAGEYLFSMFAVVSIALVASWFVAVLFSPLFECGSCALQSLRRRIGTRTECLTCIDVAWPLPCAPSG